MIAELYYMYYLKHCRLFVRNIQFQMRVEWLSQDSHQELYTFIQTKWQCFKCFIAIIVFYTYVLKCQQNIVPWSF